MICTDCDAIIPANRLAAVPDAERCVYCQRSWDVRTKRADIPNALASGDPDGDLVMAVAERLGVR